MQREGDTERGEIYKEGVTQREIQGERYRARKGRECEGDRERERQREGETERERYREREIQRDTGCVTGALTCVFGLNKKNTS